MRLNFLPHNLFYWALSTKSALTLLSHLLLAGRHNLQSRFERKSLPFWRDSQRPRSRMSSISGENGSFCLCSWTELTVLATVTSTTAKVNHDFAQCSVVIEYIISCFNHENTARYRAILPFGFWFNLTFLQTFQSLLTPNNNPKIKLGLLLCGISLLIFTLRNQVPVLNLFCGMNFSCAPTVTLKNTHLQNLAFGKSLIRSIYSECWQS